MGRFLQCVLFSHSLLLGNADIFDSGKFFSPFRVLYLFVALLKATYAENLHMVVSGRY